MSPAPPPDPGVNPVGEAWRRARLGAWPAGWLTLAYVLDAAAAGFAHYQPGFGEIGSTAGRIAMAGFDLALAGAAIWLWRQARRRPARRPAILLLIWIVVEAASKLADSHYVGLGFALLMTWGAVEGVRGAFALHRLSRTGASAGTT